MGSELRSEWFLRSQVGAEVEKAPTWRSALFHLEKIIPTSQRPQVGGRRKIPTSLRPEVEITPTWRSLFFLARIKFRPPTYLENSDLRPEVGIAPTSGWCFSPAGRDSDLTPTSGDSDLRPQHSDLRPQVAVSGRSCIHPPPDGTVMTAKKKLGIRPCGRIEKTVGDLANWLDALIKLVYA